MLLCLLLSPFYRWNNWGIKSPTSDHVIGQWWEVGFEPRSSCSWICALSHCGEPPSWRTFLKDRFLVLPQWSIQESMCVLFGFQMADFEEYSYPPHIFVTRSIFSCYWGANSPFFFYLYFLKTLYLFLTALGLLCCMRAFFICHEWGLLSSCGLLIPVASLVLGHRR